MHLSSTRIGNQPRFGEKKLSKASTSRLLTLSSQGLKATNQLNSDSQTTYGMWTSVMGKPGAPPSLQQVIGQLTSVVEMQQRVLERLAK